MINLLIDALQFYYGMNKTEAKKYIKSASEETKKNLIEGYKKQCKLAFYND